MFGKKLSESQKKWKAIMNNPKLGREVVRVSHKIDSKETEGKGKVIKIKDSYYRLRELG